MLESVVAYARRHHIGLIALAVACTGTAYAATTIGSKQIKDDSIRSADIKGGAVKASDLNDGVDPTASATVIDGQLLNADGFTGISHPSTGLYELAPVVGAPTCNVVATLVQPLGSGAANSTVSIDASSGAGITFATADADGNLADLGGGLGYSGFSVIATC